MLFWRAVDWIRACRYCIGLVDYTIRLVHAAVDHNTIRRSPLLREEASAIRSSTTTHVRSEVSPLASCLLFSSRSATTRHLAVRPSCLQHNLCSCNAKLPDIVAAAFAANVTDEGLAIRRYKCAVSSFSSPTAQQSISQLGCLAYRDGVTLRTRCHDAHASTP